MKKRLIQLALILGLMTLTCAVAQATESDADSGFRKLHVEDAYASYVSLTALDASNRAAKLNEDDSTYPGAVKVDVTYTNPQSGSEYLLILLVDGDDEDTPTVDNMAYIDQKTAGTSDLNFTVYPKKVDAKTQSVTYSVYMSSNSDASTGNGVTAYDKVASFEYYSDAPDVMLGDADDDGEIMVNDAVVILRYLVRDSTLEPLSEKQQAAADVDADGEIMVNDAVEILRYLVRDPEAVLMKQQAS